MDQNSSQPNFELPAPVSGEGEAAHGGYEAPPSRPEQAPQPPAAAAPTPMAAQSFASSQAPQPAGPAPTPASSASPSVADDNDLIEKEWVVKAKQIVAATREDPHTQSRELSKFKADYLKKRYNKDLKLEES